MKLMNLKLQGSSPSQSSSMFSTYLLLNNIVCFYEKNYDIEKVVCTRRKCPALSPDPIVKNFLFIPFIQGTSLCNRGYEIFSYLAFTLFTLKINFNEV